MTDEDYRLYKLRRFAAGILRGQGLTHFAEQAECGELDDCPEMRIAPFFIDPPLPQGDEFIAAWNEAAAQADARRGI